MSAGLVVLELKMTLRRARAAHLAVRDLYPREHPTRRATKAELVAAHTAYHLAVTSN